MDSPSLLPIEFLPTVDADVRPDAAKTEVRILSPAEIALIRPIFEQEGVPLPDPATSFVVGAIREDRVVGFLVTQLRVHVEPMWIEPGKESIFSRLVHETERILAERVGSVDVFLFAPAGKIARLAQVSGMRTEPWVVMSKHIEAMPIESSDSEQTETGPVSPINPESDEERVQ